MPYTIRPATTADGAACAAIYAPYIETAVTFESPAPDAAELSRRMEEIGCRVVVDRGDARRR